jgi:hypothetical protein
MPQMHWFAVIGTVRHTVVNGISSTLAVTIIHPADGVFAMFVMTASLATKFQCGIFVEWMIFQAFLKPPEPFVQSVVFPLLFVAVLVPPIGLWSGFLVYRPMWTSHWKLCLGVSVFLFFMPGVLEEFVFRVLLLPSPDQVSGLDWWLRAVLPWVAFVLMHVFNPRKQSRIVFRDWRFLFLAGVLGFACTWAFYSSNGSIWAPVIVHWIPVVIWQFTFSGYPKLMGDKFVIPKEHQKHDKKK